jgi:hypothetical protein
VRPGLEATRTAVVAGLEETVVDSLPLDQAALAHERMEARTLAGRLVLAPHHDRLARQTAAGYLTGLCVPLDTQLLVLAHHEAEPPRAISAGEMRPGTLLAAEQL